MDEQEDFLVALLGHLHGFLQKTSLSLSELDFLAQGLFLGSLFHHRIEIFKTFRLIDYKTT